MPSILLITGITGVDPRAHFRANRFNEPKQMPAKKKWLILDVLSQPPVARLGGRKENVLQSKKLKYSLVKFGEGRHRLFTMCLHGTEPLSGEGRLGDGQVACRQPQLLSLD